MSVLEVFGKNLRNLTALHGSQASVAQELDINRVQFQRYLHSEAFPKPNVLKRVCDYFGVDARILTELLTDEQLRSLQSGRRGEAMMNPRLQRAVTAINYCAPDQDYFGAFDEIPDGIYQKWRGSFARPDMICTYLVRVFTRNQVRLIRGYQPRSLYWNEVSPKSREREYRGMLMRQRVGLAAIYMHGPPSRIVTANYLEPVEFRYGPAVAGACFVASPNRPDKARVARCLMFRIQGGWPEAMRAARQKTYHAPEEVAEDIYSFVCPRDETF